MKIGVISGSVDMLYLFRVLNKYNFEYVVYYDQEGGDWAEKSVDFVLPRLQKAIKTLIEEQGVEKIILPPMWELLILKQFSAEYEKHILPLYTKYVLEVVLPGSRVGKIGLVGDYIDENQQDILKDLCTQYTLTENQQSIAKFHKPFVYWFKNVRMWKYFLSELGRKNWMMHKIVKTDMKKLLDAGVDVVIPMNYGYMAYDVTIQKMLSTKKCRWCGLSDVEKIIEGILQDEKQGRYNVYVMYTGCIDILKNNRKVMWLLERGKESEISSTILSI